MSLNILPNKFTWHGSIMYLIHPRSIHGMNNWLCVSQTNKCSHLKSPKELPIFFVIINWSTMENINIWKSIFPSFMLYHQYPKHHLLAYVILKPPIMHILWTLAIIRGPKLFWISTHYKNWQEEKSLTTIRAFFCTNA